MRHVYLTLQTVEVVDELFEDRVMELRNPFRVLLYKEWLSKLWIDGAAGFGFDENYRYVPPPGRVPFIPGLGPLVLNAKAQLEHRAVRHAYGKVYSTDTLPESTGGVRVAREQEDFLSQYDREDTFDSDLNAELSHRIDREGATDAFYSEDESVWHVPVSVQPRRRISVRAETPDAERLLSLAHVAPRVYAHIYPYGGLTIMLNLSVTLREDTPVADVIPLARALVRERGEPTVAFTMGTLAAGGAADFLGQIRARIITAMLPNAILQSIGPLNYGISVNADDDEISDTELSGLLTLDDRYKDLKDDWVAARARLYGRYRGDRVMATRSTLAVATSPRAFTPAGRRRFFWRCQSLMELARLQQQALSDAAAGLGRLGRLNGPDELLVRRIMGIAEHLIEFPRGLPAHHRKWFYECQRVLGGTDHITRYYAALARMHRQAEKAAILRAVEESGKPTINITGGQIGTLNLGTIIGDVENHLASITAEEGAPLREGLQQLAQAAADAEELRDDQRRELLQSVDLLAEEAGKEPEARRAGIIRPVLDSMNALAGTAAGLATVWSTVGPQILHFFGV
jgi:hypothetical protein